MPALQGTPPALYRRSLPTPRSAAAHGPLASSKAAAHTSMGTRLVGWVKVHKLLASFVALLVVGATAGVALVILNQPVTVTPAVRAGNSPVVFADGDDVTGLLDYDFITDPTIGSGGVSASFTVKGIAGATSVTAANVLKVTNTDDANNDDWSITFTPATTVTGVTSLTMTFTDGGVTRTIDLLSASAQGPYVLSDSEAWDISVTSVLPAGATVGGAVTVSFSAQQVLQT